MAAKEAKEAKEAKSKVKRRAAGGGASMGRIISGAVGAAVAIGGATVGAEKLEMEPRTAAVGLAIVGVLGAVALKGKMRDASIGLALGGGAIYGYQKLLGSDDGEARNARKPSDELQEAVRDVIAEERQRTLDEMKQPGSPIPMPQFRAVA